MWLHPLWCLDHQNQNPIQYLCLDLHHILFFSFFFSKLSTWSSFHVHLPQPRVESCSTLGLYQPHLIHKLSIEVSTKVSSISQNQTRTFNLSLFGNWWQPIYKDIMIKIFWIHVACPSILSYVKDMDKFHEPELVAIAPPTYVLRIWIWKLTHILR
jgi:hypothetical protein